MNGPDAPVPRNAVEAVITAAARYAGAYIDEAAAEKIARQVLECADDECRISQALAAEMWERRDCRDHLRQHQRDG